MLSSYGHGNTNSLSCHTNCKNPVIKIKGFVKLFGHLSLQMIWVLFYVGLIVQAVIFDKLLQDGGIETNPGPTYSTERVVQGSFHQGNREFFGETAGIQCACNSLYALCWVQIKQIFHWGKSDLDHILVEEDCLYKSLGTFDMFSADQLPEFVKMFSHNILVRYVRLETQLTTLTFGDSFWRNFFRENANNASTTLSQIFMEGFTTEIISTGNCYYLFDSHSRDERGLSVIDGTSVLMKFIDLFEIEKYIQVAYLEYRDRQQAYFQIQFIEVTVGSTEKTEIYLQFAKNARHEHNRILS